MTEKLIVGTIYQLDTTGEEWRLDSFDGDTASFTKLSGPLKGKYITLDLTPYEEFNHREKVILENDSSVITLSPKSTT